MYVGKHAWCMCLYMYVLTSIFMQADMHEYVGMKYVCTYVDIHKSADASMHVGIIYVCMYICMEVRIQMYVGKHA